jgi:two-component system response regulator AtoC
VLPDDILFGCTPAMHAIRQQLIKACQTNVPILIQGAGGTGKEALARWVHSQSPWRNGDFVKINFASIPSDLVESELFGYQAGAFTGATLEKSGRVEAAHGGTLFLDQIADVGTMVQAKLLQFLQDGRFSRIGDFEERLVEARLISATSKSLEQEIDAGRFRADLFYRVNVVRIRLPQLSERREDIPCLAEYFRKYYVKEFAKECEPLDPRMVEHLRSQVWPGNIRQLANEIARYVLLGFDSAGIIQEASRTNSHLSFSRSTKKGDAPLKHSVKEAIRDMERTTIVEALRANHWNRRITARALKISYRSLIYKIAQAGLSSKNTAVRSEPPKQAGAAAKKQIERP